MVSKKRLSLGDDSNDSNSNDQSISSSPLRRMHDDDVYCMRRKRKQLKMTTPSPSRMIWTKTDELVILGGIVDYKKEKELSYNTELNLFYCYIKHYIEAKFSKQQLIDKIKSLKKRFRDNLAISKDGKELSFTNNDDDDLFRLSKMIWGDETECVSNENMEQAKVLVSNKDVACEEEQVSNTNVEIDSSEKEKTEEDGVDEPCVLREPVSNISKKIDNSEKEKNVEDSVDEPLVLHDPVSNISKKNDNRDKDKCVEDGVNEPTVLHEPASNISKKIDNTEKDKNVEDTVDETCVLHEPASNTSKKIDNSEKEKSAEDTVGERCEPASNISKKINNSEKDKSKEAVKDEPCLLQEAVEAQTWFQSSSKSQQKLMLKNLKNLGSEIRKELTNEFQALHIEEVKLNIKIQTFSAKLANEAVSD